MRLSFRAARRADVAAIVALLRDDALGARREDADTAKYEAAFEAMRAQGGNRIYVGEHEGRIVATYQLIVIAGLSLRAARRAQIESVRVARDLRGRGIGAAMLADAEARASAAGCALMQLTMHASRAEAARFYQRHGFEASHVGFKKPLQGD